LRNRLPGYNTGKVSRLLKRLHVFGIIKKAAKSYRYYLTKLGKELVVTAERLKATVLIPSLNYESPLTTSFLKKVRIEMFLGIC
jgi:DNA-binding HxlR family transcriptional regulator